MSQPDHGTCRSCGVPILWGVHTGTGKKIPVDPSAGGEHRTGTRFQWDDALHGWATCKDDEPGYVSHFFTCPNAAHHRRDRQLALAPDDGTDG